MTYYQARQVSQLLMSPAIPVTLAGSGSRLTSFWLSTSQDFLYDPTLWPAADSPTKDIKTLR